MQKAERERTNFTRVEAAIHAEASARIEGVSLDAETKSIMGRWAEGDCSSEELDDWIQKQVQNAKKTKEYYPGAKLIG